QRGEQERLRAAPARPRARLRPRRRRAAPDQRLRPAHAARRPPRRRARHLFPACARRRGPRGLPARHRPAQLRARRGRGLRVPPRRRGVRLREPDLQRRRQRARQHPRARRPGRAPRRGRPPRGPLRLRAARDRCRRCPARRRRLPPRDMLSPSMGARAGAPPDARGAGAMTLLRHDVGREDAPLRAALLEAFERVLARGSYHFGPEAEAFERELLAALDAPPELHALGVGSGTDALTLALSALGVGPGDEVVTVANAGAPTPTAIRRTGAEVVFCDVLPESGLMDPASVASLVGPKTRALIPVHLYGQVADVEALAQAAPGVPIVEDCAQAFGSRLRGRAAGTLGTLAAFSFYPTKNLGALGDAGLVAGDAELVARARRLRSYGRDERGAAVELGMMSRLDELQAAALRVKLARFDASLARRRAL